MYTSFVNIFIKTKNNFTVVSELRSVHCLTSKNTLYETNQIKIKSAAGIFFQQTAPTPQ